ncbi:hypothetical protein PMAYCL1PPCAC_31265, partial [Pristionchus mayeri]
FKCILHNSIMVVVNLLLLFPLMYSFIHQMAFVLGKCLTVERFDIFPSRMVTKGKKKMEEIVTYRMDGGVEVERVIYHMGTKGQCRAAMKRITNLAGNEDEEEDEGDIDMEMEKIEEYMKMGRGMREKRAPFELRVKEEPLDEQSSSKATARIPTRPSILHFYS